MYDYGSARHDRQRKLKRTEIATQSSVDRKSVDTRTVVQKLRFFLMVCVVGCVVAYLCLTKVLPHLVYIQDPSNILLTDSSSEQEKQYFVHLNPDINLNYAVMLPGTQTEPVAQKNASHLLGVLIQENFIKKYSSKDPKNIADLFSYALRKEEPVSLMKRIQLIHLYLYAKKQQKLLSNVTSIEQISQQLSDNQAIWKNKKTRDCPIAVVNTTNIQGLAQSYSAILEKSGGYIIRVTSSSTLKDKSAIYMNNTQSCLDIEKDIEFLFPNGVENHLDTAVTDEYRAGIVIFLGNDAQ